MSRKRVDELGRAYAGSQLQIQIYVNRLRSQLEYAIVTHLSFPQQLQPEFHWVSPIEQFKFREYHDGAFLKSLGLENLNDCLRDYWPIGGPRWDALATLKFSGGKDPTGVLLVEAKSRTNEVYDKKLRKWHPASRRRIERALNQTKRWLRVEEEVDWTGRLYQSGNRLAHLHFFRDFIANPVPTWLVNIYFINDPHSPTSEPEWNEFLPEIKAELGLRGITPPYSAEVFLDAQDRSLLASG